MAKQVPTHKTKKTKIVQLSPLGVSVSSLRLINFMLLFSIIGVLFLYFSKAAQTPGWYGSVEQDQVNRINTRRAAIGKNALSHIECLNSIAEQHTMEMVKAGYIYHTSAADMQKRVDSSCGSNWTLIGENVGSGPFDSASLFNAFMASPAHKANIEGGFNRVGVGAYWTGSTLYITQFYANCGNCSGSWNTGATLPADPVVSYQNDGTSTGNGYFMRMSNSGGSAEMSYNYGVTSDTPLFCDWDGNGTETIGVWRAGVFYIRNNNSSGPSDISFGYGTSTDIPLCGDWDGNGTETVGVYRPSTATFHLKNSNSGGSAELSIKYGSVGDKPLVGDWDGNGTTTLGVTRGSNFYLRNSNSGGSADISFVYGKTGDKPLVGDWDGNGTETVGVWRKAYFYLRNSNSGGSANVSVKYGLDTDFPFVGDFDGNRTTTIGIKR